LGGFHGQRIDGTRIMLKRPFVVMWMNGSRAMSFVSFQAESSLLRSLSFRQRHFETCERWAEGPLEFMAKARFKMTKEHSDADVRRTLDASNWR
jgi:hypothetical protein